MASTEDYGQVVEFTHGNHVYGRLLDDISTGALLPGDRLREAEIATRLGVSRTPVREAIRLLEADGLVTHAPRVGAIVRRLDYAEVTELYEMRVVLEGTAARLTARVASDVELEELEALNRLLADAGDAAAALSLNRQFHSTLLHAARNRFLHRSMESLHKAMMILGPTTLAGAERLEGAVEEHDAILAALRARDAAEAENLMRTHIEAGQRVRLATMRDL
ncbi:MAG: GntR family transcriptional regulator [Tropicimonas sp.]|uniref:GntR family transcriptional regulator n=1 Tax=Tropicimonas sp. TaxID=2067044 RepID=UPI003A85686C